jgi:hypothetical protein
MSRSSLLLLALGRKKILDILSSVSVPSAHLDRDKLPGITVAGQRLCRVGHGHGFATCGRTPKAGYTGRSGFAEGRRVPDTLQSLTLDDSTWITAAGSDHAQEWLKEDAVSQPSAGPGEGPGGEPTTVTVPGLSKVMPVGRDKVLEYAEDRPLLELHLTAGTRAVCKSDI